MYILSRIIMGIVLGVQSVFDLRYKAIPTEVSGVGAIMGVVLSVIVGRNPKECLEAFIPGIACVLVCRVTRGALGMGDAILVLTMASVYSVSQIGYICVVAFFSSAIVALLLIVVFQKRKNYEMPFVPFLGIGWMLEFVCWYGGMG